MTSRTILPIAVALAIIPVASASCSGPPEEALVDRFFTAIQRADGGTIAGIAAARFPGGTVSGWEVLEIGPETQGPYRVPELREEESESERLRDEQFKVFYEWRTAHSDELEAIVARRANNPEAVIRGRLGGIAADWDGHRSERRRLVQSLSETQMALDAERRRAQQSLQREAPVDYLAGGTTQREVRVLVSEEDGDVEYVFSLIRYDLVNQFEEPIPARWIIAAIESAGASEETSEADQTPETGRDGFPGDR